MKYLSCPQAALLSLRNNIIFSNARQQNIRKWYFFLFHVNKRIHHNWLGLMCIQITGKTMFQFQVLKDKVNNDIIYFHPKLKYLSDGPKVFHHHMVVYLKERFAYYLCKVHLRTGKYRFSGSISSYWINIGDWGFVICCFDKLLRRLLCILIFQK